MAEMLPGVLKKTNAAMAAVLSVVLISTPVIAKADVRDCGSVSVGLETPVAFNVRSESGKIVRVQGLLRTQKEPEKLPAIVVLHGWGGLHPPKCYNPAMARISRWGYVTLLVDSASEIRGSGYPTYEYTTSDQARHAYGAAKFLASLPQVDPKRIGVLGWSTGGLSTIKAISDSQFRGVAGPTFRAAATIYPICPINIARLDVPLLLLIGAKDSTVSVTACREFATNVQSDKLQLVFYPQADHKYDVPWTPAYRQADAEDTFSRIRRHFAKHLATGSQ
ncbi:MAG: hypothetical protein GY789_16515 [Hyphomicrobiales bacterium]|nr:hypothetical protein [Hyphomicrobiales bacterium]